MSVTEWTCRSTDVCVLAGYACWAVDNVSPAHRPTYRSPLGEIETEFAVVQLGFLGNAPCTLLFFLSPWIFALLSGTPSFLMGFFSQYIWKIHWPIQMHYSDNALYLQQKYHVLKWSFTPKWFKINLCDVRTTNSFLSLVKNKRRRF